MPLQAAKGEELESLMGHEAPLVRPDKGLLVVTLVYALTGLANGGLVGAWGPSVTSIESESGLSDTFLGTLVLERGFFKLVGTLLFCYWADHLKAQRSQNDDFQPSPLSPHASLSINCVVMAVGSVVLATFWTRRGLMTGMALTGFAYGFMDCGSSVLVTWLWAGKTKQTRVALAINGAMYTLGAFLTPLWVAWVLEHYEDASNGFLALVLFSLPLAFVYPFLTSPPIDTTNTNKPQSKHAYTVPNWQVSLLAVGLFCAVGSEQSIGAWLSAYVQDFFNETDEVGATATSVFWCALCLGRVAAVWGSQVVSSSWVILFSCTFLCMLGCLVMALNTMPSLMVAMGLVGFGVGPLFPAGIAFLADGGSPPTPKQMTVFMLSCAAGEMLCPMAFSELFERHALHLFSVAHNVLFAVCLLAVLAVRPSAAA